MAERIYLIASLSHLADMPDPARDGFGAAAGIGAGCNRGPYRKRFRAGIVLPPETSDPIGEARRRLINLASSERFAEIWNRRVWSSHPEGTAAAAAARIAETG